MANVDEELGCDTCIVCGGVWWEIVAYETSLVVPLPPPPPPPTPTVIVLAGPITPSVWVLGGSRFVSTREWETYRS